MIVLQIFDKHLLKIPSYPKLTYSSEICIYNFNENMKRVSQYLHSLYTEIKNVNI